MSKNEYPECNIRMGVRLVCLLIVSLIILLSTQSCKTCYTYNWEKKLEGKSDYECNYPKKVVDTVTSGDF